MELKPIAFQTGKLFYFNLSADNIGDNFFNVGYTLAHTKR